MTATSKDIAEQKAARDRGGRIAQLMSQLAAEGERAAVIIGVAFVEEKLAELLRATMLPSEKKKPERDELLAPNRPLGTLAARIDACRRLGLIDARFARTLHWLREIRNHFAHSVETASLQEGKYFDLLQNASNEAQGSMMWNLIEVKNELAKELGKPMQPVSQLQLTLTCAATELEIAIVKSSRIDSQAPASFKERT